MMLRHGMLSSSDQVRARAMLEEHDRKQDVFNMSDDDKREKDIQKWTEWIDIYSSRLLADQKLASEAVSFEERRKSMNQFNPKVVLRNYIAEDVIAAAENGDFEPTRKLLEVLKNPFDENVDEKFSKIVSLENIDLKVT